MVGTSGVPGPPTEQAPPPPTQRPIPAAASEAAEGATPAQTSGKRELLARQRSRSQSLSIRLSSQRKRTSSAMTASASVSSAAVAKNKSKLSASTPGISEARSVSDSETGAEWDEFGISGSAHDDDDDENEDEDEFTNVPAFFLHRYNPLQVETREDGTNISNWRVVNRVRTVGIGLVMALNLTVAPPDAPPSPRPTMECWTEPPRRRQDKGIDVVAGNLQAQYLKWDPRAMSRGASRGRPGIRVKQCLDPTQEDVKRMCISLRQYAHSKRLIFHYNGHGAPRPTDNGELWLFNRDITQYIPLSLYDLQSWVRTPTIFVFESSQAGLLIKWLRRFAEQREAEHHRVRKEDDSGARPKLPSLMNDFLAVAACREDEMLPSNPDLPADLFTCCLTTPIKTALYWASKRSMLLNDLPEGQTYEDLLDDIPGSIDDRTSPLGELTWMFTAITDTIAWQVLPPNLFQELFRQDSVVASLFRNFLLAERIMSYHHCTPVSHPALPRSSQHPMWQTWDQITDIFLEQLPHLRGGRRYQPSKFFSEQLMAFDVWLDFADSKKAKSRPPEQLPILLQAMLSPQHRLNALTILCRFLDLGSWAVDLSLTVGVFHYVLQLLQKANATTVGILVFIWAKLLAVDSSCQVDLIKSKSHVFFIRVLDDQHAGGEDDYDSLTAEEKVSAHRVLIDRRVRAAFALSVMMNKHANGQKECYQAGIMRVCIRLLQDKNALLRRWALICLAKVWEDNEELKRLALQDFPNVTDHVCSRITDGSSGVRTAALYALGTFIITGQPQDSLELNLAFSLRLLSSDTNPMVRSELISTLSMVVSAYEKKFVDVVLASARQERDSSLTDQQRAECRSVVSSEYGRLWRSLYSMQSDPMPELVKQANRAVVAIHSLAASRIMVEFQGDEGVAEQMHAYLMQVAALQTKKAPRPRVAQEVALSKSGSRVDNLKSKFNGWRKSMRVSSSGLTGPASPSLSRRAANINASEPGLRSVSLHSNPSATASDGSTKQGLSESSSSISSAPSIVLSQKRAGSFQPDKSRFFHWCCEQFRSTLLEAEIDPTAPAQRTKEWKVRQHQKMLFTVSSIKEELACSKLETQVAILQGESITINQLLVHPCFPVVVSANDSDTISVFDWQMNTSLNTFSNTNPHGTFISSLSFVNIFEEYDLLMVGASDGVIRVWRMYHSAPDFGLHTAWIAHKQPQNSAGLKLLWNQSTGTVLTAGEYPVMRLWDVERGIAVQDIPTDSTSCVTSMCIDKPKGNVVLLGFQDGTVRLFDCRASAKSSLLQSYTEHKRKVLKVEMMYQSHKFVSGSTGGDVKFWDLRMPSSTSTIQAHSKSDMASLAVHQHIPLIATGTRNQTIKILNHQGQRVNDIKYYSKFLGQRIGAVTCLAFHPFRGLLAAGGGDSVVALYRSAGVRAPATS